MAAIGAGVDRHTGRPVNGWAHVLLCLECIFSTSFGSRVLRRWFGSLIPRMLGQNLDPPALLAFFTALYASLEFEPRFALTNIQVLSDADELRQGRLRLYLDGVYRPRAHLGDMTAEGARRVIISSDGTQLIAEAAG
jgi:phage baseplate assembly protein W